MCSYATSINSYTTMQYGDVGFKLDFTVECVVLLGL